MQFFKAQSCLGKILIGAGAVLLCLFGCSLCANVVSIIAPERELPETPMAGTLAITAIPSPTPVPDTATPPSTPTLVVGRTGMTRDNPAPRGQPVLADNNIEITVLGLERDAWARIDAMNDFNPRPDAGMEYIIVAATVTNRGDPAKTKAVRLWHFRVVGERGVIYDRPFLLTLSDELRGELFGGVTIQGQLAFEVPQGEKNLVLIYDSGIGTDARFLSLE